MLHSYNLRDKETGIHVKMATLSCMYRRNRGLKSKVSASASPPSCSVSIAYPAELQALTHLKPPQQNSIYSSISNQQRLDRTTETSGETSCDENHSQAAQTSTIANAVRTRLSVIMQDCIPASQQSQRRGQHRKSSILPGT